MKLKPVWFICILFVFAVCTFGKNTEENEDTTASGVEPGTGSDSGSGGTENDSGSGENKQRGAEDCKDLNNHCVKDKCISRAEYMLKNCKKTCELCGPETSFTDKDVRCPVWAQKDYCQTDSKIKEQCPHSCRKYQSNPGTHRPQASVHPAPAPTPYPFPGPFPAPMPGPFPAPMPGPFPAPMPGPIPAPTPAPMPGPFPAPFPAPMPGPIPAPIPGPIPAPIPAPFPAPMPGPIPAPIPAPFPAPMPGPMPAPAPFPAPGTTFDKDNKSEKSHQKDHKENNHHSSEKEN